MIDQTKYALYVTCRVGKGYAKFMGPQTNYGIVGSAVCLADVDMDIVLKNAWDTKRVLFTSKEEAESFVPVLGKMLFPDSEITIKEVNANEE